MIKNDFEAASAALRSARRAAAFTGAGISVESGIPPFRGPDGIYNRINPALLGIDYFLRDPAGSWKILREIFFELFGKVKPNLAHIALARLEHAGKLACVVTQNIDNLHQQAGSQCVIEFHGNSQRLVCLDCGKFSPVNMEMLETLPPRCGCGGILKPDFVFFGESIPADAYTRANHEALACDVWLVVGSTGEVYPAASVPILAKRNGSKIIEVNVRPSEFTWKVTDFFLEGEAGATLSRLVDLVLL